LAKVPENRDIQRVLERP
jgi:hypothetical protein